MKNDLIVNEKEDKLIITNNSNDWIFINKSTKLEIYRTPYRHEAQSYLMNKINPDEFHLNCCIAPMTVLEVNKF